MDIIQKIEQVKRQLAATPNDSKLQVELKRLIAERNDRLDMLLIPNDNQTKKAELIDSATPTTHLTRCERIYFNSEKLSEGFWWDSAVGLATFDSGAVYTEQEIRDLSRQGVSTQALSIIHSQKKLFPRLRYVSTIADGGRSDNQQEDELDILFKDLKGNNNGQTQNVTRADCVC